MPSTVQATSPTKLVLRTYRLQNSGWQWLWGGREKVESCVYEVGTTEGTDTLSVHKHDPGLLLVRVRIIQATMLQNRILPVAKRIT